VIEAATNAVIGLDISGTIVSWNRAAERIFGYSAQEARGRSIAELAPSAEAAEEILGRLHWAMPDDGKSIARRRDGSLFPIVRALRPIFGEMGKPIGGVVICADVSAHEELQQKLANEEYLASLGRVAGRVSHEFNNVLMGILPFVELIERSASDNKLVTAAKHMRTSLQRGRQITEEIRFFTRASAPLQVAPVATADLAAAIEDQVRNLIGTSIDLSIENKLGDVQILCHSAQIVQAIINLVLNAKDAMPSGGRIAVVFAPFGKDFAEIAVIDSGAGMDEMTLSRIFEPLFTTKPKGTGLGLAIVRYIIDRHGGSIDVSSRAGEGTTFRIRLRAVTDNG
jgi:two-component system cell cycle sensor histidine kinase/response regulator CckA